MLKQIIIARRDLKMSPGKLAAQVSHASMAAVTQFMRHIKADNGAGFVGFNYEHHLDVYDWLFNGSFTKVVLGVDTEDQLNEILKSAHHLNPVSIVDSGRTELNGFNLTCVGFPPMQADLIDQHTKHLKLY